MEEYRKLAEDAREKVKWKSRMGREERLMALAAVAEYVIDERHRPYALITYWRARACLFEGQLEHKEE